MKRGLLLALVAAGGAAAHSAPPQGRSDFPAFLRSQISGDRGNPALYSVAWIDLNGDRRPEAIVYLQSRGRCGTGGCTTFIYRATGRVWAQVARLPANHPPIRLLNTRSHGWRDLAVGRIELRRDRFIRYEDRIRFNGRTYPIGQGIRMTRPAPGRVLISENDRGRPLF